MDRDAMVAQAVAMAIATAIFLAGVIIDRNTDAPGYLLWTIGFIVGLCLGLWADRK